ncbi:MAG TPA: hypothetical protein VJL27_01540 [Patescibacteria group bacterium]|nr:hypothetical protein [Patescibacteria group bacterium]
MPDSEHNIDGPLVTNMPSDYTAQKMDSRAPIESMSPAAPPPEPPSPPPVTGQVESIGTSLTDNNPNQNTPTVLPDSAPPPTPPPSSSGADTPPVEPTEERDGDAFLDQLLAGQNGGGNQNPPPVPAPPPTAVLPQTPPPPEPNPVSPVPPAADFPGESEIVDLRQPTPSPAREAPTANSQPTPKRSSGVVGLIIVLIILLGGVVAAYMLFINKPSDLAVLPLGGESTDSTLTGGKNKTSVTAESLTGVDLTRHTDLTNLQKALEQYFAANQKYPVSPSATQTQDAAGPLQVLVPQYLLKIPVDPSGGTRYYGYESVDGGTYALTAVFDALPSGITATTTADGGYQITLSPGVILSSSTPTTDTANAAPPNTP